MWRSSRKFRGPGNVLGAAVQLCTLPWLGFVPGRCGRRRRRRGGAAVGAAGHPGRRAARYGAREQTRTDHLREVAQYLGWRAVGRAVEWKELDEFLFARAMEHDSPKLLFRLACEYLISVAGDPARAW